MPGQARLLCNLYRGIAPLESLNLLIHEAFVHRWCDEVGAL